MVQKCKDGERTAGIPQDVQDGEIGAPAYPCMRSGFELDISHRLSHPNMFVCSRAEHGPFMEERSETKPKQHSTRLCTQLINQTADNYTAEKAVKPTHATCPVIQAAGTFTTDEDIIASGYSTYKRCAPVQVRTTLSIGRPC